MLILLNLLNFVSCFKKGKQVGSKHNDELLKTFMKNQEIFTMNCITQMTLLFSSFVEAGGIELFHVFLMDQLILFHSFFLCRRRSALL